MLAVFFASVTYVSVYEVPFVRQKTQSPAG